MIKNVGRRDFLKASVATGALALLPRRAAAADPLVVATFPGTWNEAHRDVLAPYFRKKTGADVTQTILLATDQVAKLEAARGKPPFDVAIMDEGPLLDAVKAGVIEKYPVDKSPNYKDLVPAFQEPWGPKISLQVIGIGLIPRKSESGRNPGTICSIPPTRAAWASRRSTARSGWRSWSTSPRRAAAARATSSRRSRRSRNCCRA